MTSKNEHTGDKQQTRPPSDKYRDNYDKVDNSWIREKAKERKK